MQERQIKVAPLVEKRRRMVMEERPLNLKEVSMLASMRWKNEPLFGNPDFFFSDDYKKVMDSMTRPITDAEIQELLKVVGRDGQPKYMSDEFVPIHGKPVFLTEEQAKDLLGLEQVERYRKATAEEASVLYSDPYSREVVEGIN